MAKIKKPEAKAYKKVERINVYIWSQFVGAVALDPKLGFYVFAFDQDFGKSGIELSPLQMPLNNTEEPYVFTDLPESTYRRLPAMLADALPDDFGNALIDRYMANKGIARSQITALDRLAYMANRSMGALEFKPSQGPKTEKTTALEMNSLVTQARNLIRGVMDHDDTTNAALRNIIEVGTSAGGARAKAVIAWNAKTSEIRSGQLDAPTGFEHWLLKFDGIGADKALGVSQDYGRIEYAYYLMAVSVGITMSESRLLEENGRAHFMTKRFDREQGHIKHHMQSLCAMNHIDYKKKSANSYEQLFLTIRELKIDRAAEVEAYRRMVFNIMSRNCDDHTKNVSFLLKRGGNWEQAPAYDVTFAYNPKGEWTSQHLMSANGKFKDFTREDLLAVADRFGIGEASAIIATTKKAIESWSAFSKKAGIAPKISSEIKRQHLIIK
jgi:serine/threonine-protein kinase HipA